MSELVYCQVRLNRPNKQYDISYSSTQPSLQTSFDSELDSNSVREWKSLQDASRITIPLTKFQDGVSDDIGEVNEEGFELDLKKMQPNKKYSVMYDNSIYEVHKNEQNELVVSEIG